METRPYVPWKLMNDFMVDAFQGYGVPEEDARICADVLLESDRRGIESPFISTALTTAPCSRSQKPTLSRIPPPRLS